MGRKTNNLQFTTNLDAYNNSSDNEDDADEDKGV
jgi:hypothetical protein